MVLAAIAWTVIGTACADDGPGALGVDGSSISSEESGDRALLDAAVAVRVTACRPIVERGTGLVIERGRVLTSAHVVAGATSIRVFTPSGEESDAEVLAFDPLNDLAVLAVDVGLGRPLPLAVEPPTGAFDGRVVVFRQDRPVVEPIEVTRRVRINTEDIYRGDAVTRPGYELRADVRAGDSGGVVVHEGAAVAVVWSRSRVTGDRAWAIDPIRGGAALRRQLATGVIDDAVDLGRCA